jgi:hypothetical protein
MTQDQITNLYPEMMGDETEEQNLNQVGHPSARILEDEVDAAFAPRAEEPGSRRLAALTDRINAVRDQVQHAADAARSWTARQADAARHAAAERPVLAVSASAGTALALGLAVGFLLGRASAED